MTKIEKYAILGANNVLYIFTLSYYRQVLEQPLLVSITKHRLHSVKCIAFEMIKPNKINRIAVNFSEEKLKKSNQTYEQIFIWFSFHILKQSKVRLNSISYINYIKDKLSIL